MLAFSSHSESASLESFKLESPDIIRARSNMSDGLWCDDGWALRVSEDEITALLVCRSTLW